MNESPDALAFHLVMRVDAVGGPDALVMAAAKLPIPRPGEIRVRVAAAGVNPVDAEVRAGLWPILGEPPFVVGWDVAGTVDALGDGVVEFTAGDRVFGMPHFPAEAAAYGEYVTAPADQFAPTPDNLDDVHAAAIPLAGLTAWRALVTVAGVRAGQRVLIHGAGGGVGHLAIQIAKARGAHVITTASPAKAEFARSLGADEVIDYTSERFELAIEPVDVALDSLGGDVTARTISVVRAGGVLLSLTEVADDSAGVARAKGVRFEEIDVVPDRDALLALADLAANGDLVPHVGAEYSLEDAAEAHRRLAEGVIGKIVLVVAAPLGA